MDHPQEPAVLSDMGATGDIVGIDLGTTNSLIGIMEAGFPILLANAEGSRLTPSVVYYGPPPEGKVEVGSAALRRRTMESGRVVTSVKRLMGSRVGELDEVRPFPVQAGGDGRLRLHVSGRECLPEDVSADILRSLKATAEAQLGRTVSRAVITVPAYFNDGQRQATLRAGELAGFTVERILNEPTAAALAYGLDRQKERSMVAVYDLGGGTFDLSILELNEGIFHVLATHGDTRLGGDDLDAALLEHLLTKHFPEGLTDSAALARLAEQITRAKHALSTQEAVEIAVPFLNQGENFACTVTRAEFEKMARPILERTRRHCLQAMADARLKPEEIERVLLVGGSTRIPLVRTLVAEIFGRDPDTSQHPDETVALGAVVQAAMLSGALRQMTLLDVTPLSLGLETFGGLMNVILPRNTTIPSKAGEMFTNPVDGQEAMLIRVLQGEREMAVDNWLLGQFEVPFPSGPRGSARVGVQFSIDANGILQVLARDTGSGKDTVLEIQSSAVAVDDARVEEMISASVEHAFEDMHERQWTEARLKAEELLQAVSEAMTVAAELISPEEAGAISQATVSVAAALEAKLLPQLKAANQALDLATEALAARLVERAMDERLGL